jgi:hypothetical protein
MELRKRGADFPGRGVHGVQQQIDKQHLGKS